MDNSNTCTTSIRILYTKKTVPRLQLALTIHVNRVWLYYMMADMGKNARTRISSDGQDKSVRASHTCTILMW